MKKILSIVIISVVLINFSYAQNEEDALRYSQNYYGGTARFMSMGGAFGALGGDLSAAAINPAGIGLFRKSEFSITPNFYYNSVNSNYKNSSYVNSKYDFNFSNLGFVGTSSTGESGSGWQSTSFAISYSQLNNFDKSIVIEGVNNSSSLLDSWVNNVNSGYYGDVEQMGLDAGLIYNIINNDTLANFISDFTGSSYGQFQRKSIYTKGGIGEYLVSFAANYNNKLYVGGGIGFQRIHYTENSELYENDPNDIIPYFGSLTFKDHLNVYGKGFNLKLGFIFKPVYSVRIGASVQTPTFYDIKEEYYSELESSIDFGYGLEHDSYETPKGNFNYQLTTPYKANTSLAFIIKKTAIISLDYEFVDYTNAQMFESSYTFSDENNNIRNRYKATNNLRVGLEYKIGPLSLRGGYALYGSPYASSEANSNATFSTYSIGFGTRGNGYYFDLGYIYTQSDQKYFLYGAEESSLNSATSQVVATVGFRF
ncbi:MAG: hypothetical protein GXO79_13440 [Chlorobi bacterium]|nr:hypothetical protein [Chlorobiota bacterium]